MKVGLLYHRQDCFEKGRRFRWHEHPFWQFEICLSGSLEVLVGDESIVLDPGDCYVVPPRLRHCFAYLGEENHFLSIKYELLDSDTKPRVGCIKSANTLRRFSRLLEALIPRGEHVPTDESDGLARVFEGLLLHLSEDPAGDSMGTGGSYGELISRVLRIIDEGKGRIRQVGELAAEVGVTQGHLRSRFKRETGASLKEKVDTVCMERARFLLAYSDRSVSELAGELGFPDLFAFSRFFKTRQGVSPRAYRGGLES